MFALIFFLSLATGASFPTDEQGPDVVALLQTGLEFDTRGSGTRRMGSLQDATATEASKVGDMGSVAQVLDSLATATTSFSMKNVVAEYILMTLFVTIGCGSAMAIAKEEGSAWVLQVAFAFGLAITTLAYGLGRYSGGQINCAVTFGLWLSGDLGLGQAIVNFVAQMLGSLTGAIFLCIIFPAETDKTGSLASNAISEGFGYAGVLLGELVMTFILMITVLESSLVTQPASGIAVIPIGFAVFLAHCVLIPIDGCSINPTRTFGPAVIASLRNNKVDTLKDMWVFWVGPLLGAAIAALVHELMTR